MSVLRRTLPGLLALLVFVPAISTRAQSTPPLASNDSGPCDTGDFRNCVVSETARCDAGEAKACHSLAFRYYRGVGVSRDEKRGHKLHVRILPLAESACTKGDQYGCAFAAFVIATSIDPHRDLVRAGKLAERSCEGGIALACFGVGNAALFGGMGISRDPARGAQLLETICAGGYALACFQLGQNYELGRTVGQDYARATVLYHHACEAAREAHEMNACHYLGSAYDEGRGVTEDAASAAQLYDRACRGADASGCNSLGYFYERGRAVALDASRAAQLYERACQLANPSGCDNLAVLFEGGNGVLRDTNRAKRLRQQACELAPRPSCRRD